ncbi:hypothetical protein ACMDCR_13985 [Labrys okinawensis]|uniref:hypothetical protein n=1 Tax=Labrys okinawensis TaxID=346911 RepID=UPI0039BD92E6
MTVPVVRLVAISFALAIALPAAPALAGWRDGPYYTDDGWGGDYYPPARAYRPYPLYRDEYQPNYGYYQRPWAGRRQAYAPYYDEPDYYGPDNRAPAARPRVIRPPRNVSGMPDQPRRLAPVKPKVAGVGPEVKPAPAVKADPVQEARALPVPRPNLEIMDFDAATPATPAPATPAPAAPTPAAP